MKTFSRGGRGAPPSGIPADIPAGRVSISLVRLSISADPKKSRDYSIAKAP
jgi:hypothetical protein